MVGRVRCFRATLAWRVIDDPVMVQVMQNRRKFGVTWIMIRQIISAEFAPHLLANEAQNRRNLKVLCQRCHLMYDRTHQAKRRRINRRKREMARGQLAFEI